MPALSRSRSSPDRPSESGPTLIAIALSIPRSRDRRRGKAAPGLCRSTHRSLRMVPSSTATDRGWSAAPFGSKGGASAAQTRRPAKGPPLNLHVPSPALDRRLLRSTASAEADPDIATILGGELKRQQDQIELIASENIVSQGGARGAGLGADQQVRRGLSGQALLRRLRIRRRGRDAWPSSAPSSCSAASSPTSSRTRAARPTRRCSWPCMTAGRHLPGHGPGRRRPPDPRHAASTSRASGSSRGLRRARPGPPDRLRRGRRGRPREQAQADHRRRLGLFARTSTSPRFREIADEVGAILMVRHGPLRRPDRRRASIPTRCRTPTSSPPPRTRPCAARAAA